MNLVDLNLVRLDDAVNLKPFFCSDSDLKEFLYEDAKRYVNELLATTFILENNSDTVAYFSILNDSVNLKSREAQTVNRFNRPIPNAKRVNNYLAIKLGRLAVSDKYQSHHIGSQVLQLVKRWFKPNKLSGCRFILVDAYATAIPFYECNGFKFLTKEDGEEDTRLMYFDLKRFV